MAFTLIAACGSPDGSTTAGGDDPGTSVPGSTPADPDAPTSDDPYDRGDDCPEPSPEPGASPDEPVTRGPCPNPEPPGGAGFEIAEPYDGPTTGVRAVQWQRSRARGADDRSFLLIYWSGVEPCNVLDRVEVEENADEVVATIYEGSAADQQNVACIEIGVKKAVRITLDAPLGDRDLIDGAD